MQTTTLDPVTPLPDVISLPLTPIPLVINSPEVPAIFGTPVPIEVACYRCPGKATTECDRCGKSLCNGCYEDESGPCHLHLRLCGPCMIVRDTERRERYNRYREASAAMSKLYPYPFLERLEQAYGG